MINSNHFKRVNGLNCAEYLIRAVANYYERDYEMMFIGSWGFDLDCNKNIYNDDYISDHTTDSWRYLKKHHGIEIRWHGFKEYKDFEEFVRDKLKNDEPVMVCVDLYWIPWVVQDYQREHWGHMVLIVAENTDGWLCYDFFSTEQKLLPHNHMEHCFCDVYDFKLHIYSEIDFDQCETEIKQGLLDNLIKTDAFKKMNQLSECILMDFKRSMIERSITLGDFQTSDLMEKLNRLSQRRSQFALMLGYFFKSSKGAGEITSFEKQLSYCAACWKSVWGLLQKAYLMKDPSTIIEKVSKKIKEISCVEQKICEALLCEKKIVLDATKEYLNSSIQLMAQNTSIAIEDIANHRSIQMEGKKNTSSINDIFIIEDAVLKERKICIGNIMYKLCNSDIPFDNVSCMGQRILVNKKIVGFSMLSNADYAHQTENIVICGYDKEVTLPFNVTYSQWHTTEFGQHLAWRGTAGIMRGSVIETHPLQICIYNSDFWLGQAFYVKEIVLPYCPNIHIYGIIIYYYEL